MTPLHYACQNKASARVILELVRSRDSFVDKKLKQKVAFAIEAMALSQQCSGIHIAAEYGLRWSIFTQDLAESNVDEVVNSCDGSTGLRLFMVGAAIENAGGFCDLSSIYGLMRMSPTSL